MLLRALPSRRCRSVVPVLEFEDEDADVRSFAADPAAAGMRVDLYLAQALPEISRARVQTADRCGPGQGGWCGAQEQRQAEGRGSDRDRGPAQPGAAARGARGHPARHPVRGQVPGGGEQAGEHDGACRRGGDGRRAQSRHAGECAAVPHGQGLCPTLEARCGPGSCIGWTSRRPARSSWQRTT